jgi:hypothetical protein
MFTLHKRIEQSKHSEVKGIKKALKKFACPFMDGRVCVCLFVCLEPKVKLNKILGA